MRMTYSRSLTRLLVFFLLLILQSESFLKYHYSPKIRNQSVQTRTAIRTATATLDTAITNPNVAVISQLQQQNHIQSMLDSQHQGILQKLKLQINGRLLNGWGCLFGAIVFLVTGMLLPVLTLAALICDLRGEHRRRKTVDYWINIWSVLILTFTCSEVLLLGANNLPDDPNEPVIYVPNHTSFLDIFALSGRIPRTFKYFSKSDILKIPLVGWGMQLAQHVFLDRKKPKSAVESVNQCIVKIKDGNSMVVFAEGTRSPDGKLGSFKNGAFRIAEKTGARIVPVSIGNLFKYMPPGCLGPLRRISKAYVMIHPPIDPKGKSVKEVRTLCYQAVNSGLPPYQQTVMKEGKE